MNKTAKKLAHKILIKYTLRNDRDYNNIADVIEKQGFVLIFFKKDNNTSEVSECIKKLHLEDQIQHNNSFIYLNNNLKLVFINSDLSDEDKYILLCHELGHILDPSLQNSNFSYFKIQNEEFANEFSYHLQNPGICIKLRLSKLFRIALFLFFIVCLLFIARFGLSNAKNSLPTSTTINSDERSYVTSHGEKYHKSFCIIIKNRTNLKTYSSSAEAEKDGYKPCLLCIGEE